MDRKLNISPFKSISVDFDVAGDGDANVGTNVDKIPKSFPTIGGSSNLPDSKWRRFEIEKSHSYLDIDMDKHWNDACSMSMDNNEADATDAAVARGRILKIKRPVSDGPWKSPLSSEDQSK